MYNSEKELFEGQGVGGNQQTSKILGQRQVKLQSVQEVHVAAALCGLITKELPPKETNPSRVVMSSKAERPHEKPGNKDISSK